VKHALPTDTDISNGRQHIEMAKFDLCLFILI